ncbi:hypothetical protein PIB30_053864 [Stylosanthes scabra]|uniref:Aminotransferase-like plant mobile domain-containing protein n=1 Tax=Stylosanthes scabra TaxID=79078 RepID=A0ABU6QIG0_9FABA|nr:hypothetical protein [Stylosanthes scabra]
MAEIPIPTPPRQPGVLAAAARSKDIQRKNADGWHIATTSRILHAWRNSHDMIPPEILMPYFREAGFGHDVMLTDFYFEQTLLSAFLEKWRPETLMNSFFMMENILELRGSLTYFHTIASE